jgi:hypothetical protein
MRWKKKCLKMILLRMRWRDSAIKDKQQISITWLNTESRSEKETGEETATKGKNADQKSALLYISPASLLSFSLSLLTS